MFDDCDRVVVPAERRFTVVRPLPPMSPATSPWDDEYKKWAYEFANGIFASPNSALAPASPVPCRTSAPAALPAAALAGMANDAHRLYESHKQFVDDLVAGQPLTKDPDLRFLVGVTSGADNRTYIGGLHRGLLATLALHPTGGATITESRSTLSSALHFIPFSLVLVQQDSSPEYPHVDCTEWLRLGVDDVVADLKFAFPGVRLVAAEPQTASDDGPTLVWPFASREVVPEVALAVAGRSAGASYRRLWA